MDAQDLLDAYVKSSGREIDEYRDALSETVRELVHRSVGKRETGDLEDFEEECVVAIWMKISALRGDGCAGIDNLEAFVRQAVHNRYCDAIRRKRPKWYNLKLELMEIFSGKADVEGFAMWQNPDSGLRLCGFAEWSGSSRAASARCREITDNVSKFRSFYLQNRDPQELPVYELAAAVLDSCGGPVEVDALTSCLAELVRARKEEPLSIDAVPDGDEDSGAPVDWLISPDTEVEKQVVDASWFGHVITWFWKEFLELSLKQRKALLYGMSGEQVMALCAAVGMREVANSVDMGSDHLASLINALPLPDATTAQELGILTRAVPSVRFKAWGRIRRRTQKSALALDE
jgi:DNA-directed RNA polymerase specialized sigma24 family protein